MRNGILKTDVENRGLVLDPRTKLLLLITMSVFVLGSAGSGEIAFLSPCLCFCPMLLLISCKKYSSAGLYAVVYSAVFYYKGGAVFYTGSSVHFYIYWPVTQKLHRAVDIFVEAWYTLRQI